ncbi:hypothetical protein [Actinokineospora spheciospongiae]|uniref:hypothetical protein n=1 Tax=Actinokineospora spheciospongiae TaxID=909613 RepID=UPI000D71AF16|nr:hypothetical protein [Actinokineospora spheciospongiae]PWW50266.1 hypothetical protein DFQ13_12328 [Actinokineospora spheciospongiae]
MIDLHVVPDEGEPYNLHITSRDIMAWERVTKGMTFAKLQENMSFTHLYNLAHRAASRSGKFSGTRDEFEASADLDIMEEDDEESDSADPTHAGA